LTVHKLRLQTLGKQNEKYFDNDERTGTIAEYDGGHGGEDSTDGGILDVALLRGLDGLCEVGGSHR